MTVIGAIFGYMLISLIGSLVIGRFLSLATSEAVDMAVTVPARMTAQPSAAVGD